MVSWTGTLYRGGNAVEVRHLQSMEDNPLQNGATRATLNERRIEYCGRLQLIMPGGMPESTVDIPSAEPLHRSWGLTHPTQRIKMWDLVPEPWSQIAG